MLPSLGINSRKEKSISDFSSKIPEFTLKPLILIDNDYNLFLVNYVPQISPLTLVTRVFLFAIHNFAKYSIVPQLHVAS